MEVTGCCELAGVTQRHWGGRLLSWSGPWVPPLSGALGQNQPGVALLKPRDWPRLPKSQVGFPMAGDAAVGGLEAAVPRGSVGECRKRGGLPGPRANPVWSSGGATVETRHGPWSDSPGHGRSGRWSRGRPPCGPFPGPAGPPPVPETNWPAIRPEPARGGLGSGPTPAPGPSLLGVLWVIPFGLGGVTAQLSSRCRAILPRFGASLSRSFKRELCNGDMLVILSHDNTLTWCCTSFVSLANPGNQNVLSWTPACACDEGFAPSGLKPTHCRFSLWGLLGSHTKLPGTNPPELSPLTSELRIGPFSLFL